MLVDLLRAAALMPGSVGIALIAALRVKKPQGEARTAGHSLPVAKVRNEGQRLFGRNPSGRDRFCPSLPLSSRQWVGHWPLLIRCTGQKRPPPQRPKQCQQTLVLEGILPFLAPDASKRAYGRLASLPDGWLRRAGLVAMLAGVASLQLIHWAA